VKTVAGAPTGPDPNSVYSESSITNAQAAYMWPADTPRTASLWKGSRHLGARLIRPRCNMGQRQVVNNSAGPVGHPSIAATHGGSRVMVAYERIDPAAYEPPFMGYDVYYVYSSNGGVNWSGPYGLATSLSDEARPALAVDGCGSTSNSVFGNIHAVYSIDEHMMHMTSGWYCSAPYSNLSPAAWSTREDFSYDVYLPVITTQQRSGTWYPCIAQSADIFTWQQWWILYETKTTPPTVTTSAAAPVGSTTATLNGNLTDLGTAACVNFGTASSVQVSFQWG